MATAWDAAIKNSKQLTVFPHPTLVQTPAWGGALFKRLLDEFNRLSGVNRLGVTLVASSTKPAEDGPAGANVQINVSAGTHKFTVGGTEHTASLPAGTGPSDLVGVTHPVSQGGELIRAFIFVPLNPTIGGSGARGVGNGVKLSITIHELIHACGLDESEHSPVINPDVFTTLSSLSASFPPDGNPGDRLDLGRRKFVPPIFITARTASLIRSNWS
jgi:hypothetical protein